MSRMKFKVKSKKFFFVRVLDVDNGHRYNVPVYAFTKEGAEKTIQKKGVLGDIGGAAQIVGVRRVRSNESIGDAMTYVREE